MRSPWPHYIHASPEDLAAGWVYTEQVFTYSEGRWGYGPYDLDIYHGHTIGSTQPASASPPRRSCSNSLLARQVSSSD